MDKQDKGITEAKKALKSRYETLDKTFIEIRELILRKGLTAKEVGTIIFGLIDGLELSVSEKIGDLELIKQSLLQPYVDHINTFKTKNKESISWMFR
jgi:hypothetical protein